MMTRLRALLPAGYDAGTIELTYRGRTGNNPHGTN